MGKKLTIEELRNSLKAEEKVSLEMLEKLNEINDPYYLLSSQISMILDMFIAGNKDDAVKWIRKTEEVYAYYKKKQIPTKPLFRLDMEVLNRFVMTYIEGKANWSILKEYHKKYKEWEKETYKKKEKIDCIDDSILLSIAVGDNVNNILESYEHDKLKPYPRLLLDAIKISDNEKIIKKIKTIMFRKIIMYGFNYRFVIPLLAYHNLISKEMTPEDFIEIAKKFLFE